MYCPTCDIECEELEDFFECPECGDQFDLDSDPDDPELLEEDY